MTATIKATIFAQAKTEFDSNPMYFLEEDFAAVEPTHPKRFHTVHSSGFKFPP